MINDPNVFNDVEMNKEHGSNRAGNGQHHGIYGDHFASDDQDYLHGNSAGSRINTRDNKVSSGLLTSIYGDPFARNNGNTVPAQGLRASYNLTASHKSNIRMQGVYSDKTKSLSIYSISEYFDLCIFEGGLSLYKDAIDTLKSNLENNGYIVNNYTTKNFNNKDILYFELTYNEHNAILCVMESVNPNYVFAFTVETSNNDFSSTSLEKAMNIILDSTYVGDYSNYQKEFTMEGLNLVNEESN